MFSAGAWNHDGGPWGEKPAAVYDMDGHMAYIETSTVLINPDLAAMWLKTGNTANRSISERQVDKLANDMRMGNWRQTHQGIAFYEDGVLADGQHRLSAIIKSGIAQQMLVVTGLDRADSIGIDQNRPRSAIDTLRIAGGDTWISKDVVAVSRFLLCITGTRLPSISEIGEFANAYRDCILFALSTFGKSRRGISVAPVFAGVAVAAMNGIDRQRLSEFSEILLSGVATSPTHMGAIRLREWLMRPAAVRGAAYQNSVYLRTQRAIEAFAMAQPLGRLFEPSEPIWNVPEQAQSREAE